MAYVLLLVGAAAVLAVIMAFAWAVAVVTGRSGFVDATWSLAVGIVGVAVALLPVGGDTGLPGERQWLAAGLCALWSLRLGGHILLRTLKSGDDPRYAKLKADWGKDYLWSFFWFLQAQAVAAFVLDMAVFAAARSPAPGLSMFDGLGAVLALVALAGETIADRQMQQFRADPANQGGICDDGLWGWSRHPNYFFEWLGWLAFPLIAASGPLQFVAIAVWAPVQMYWLLLHVSGIPPLEAHLARSRGAAFADYCRRVNMFWPWPPSR